MEAQGAASGRSWGRSGVRGGPGCAGVLCARELLLKRGLDLFFGVLLALICLPVVLIAAVAVFLDSPGPVLFSHERVGHGGRRFRCLKLRTMRDGADREDHEHLDYVAGLIRGDRQPQGGVYKLRDDPRVTRVGKVLRRFSIDEVPQLWNVIRGDMSLVGPRPPMPSEVELYDEQAWRRLDGPAGLTGLWQVSGRNRMGFHEMVALDVEYLESWSLLLDLRILARTPIAMLSSRGAA